MGGCDKTVPAQLMAATSANLPAIQLVAGPMSTSRHRGERLGACTDCRRFWARFRAGGVDEEEISLIEGRLASTAGTCSVMGTASTMASITEALGMSLPGTAAIPAVHADRLRAGEETGKRAVELIGSELTPRRIITPESVENAMRLLLAVGGSTNAVIHLTAVARRAGIVVDLARFNKLSDETPVLVNLKPVGEHYMDDLFFAGGVPAILREIRDLLNLRLPDGHRPDAERATGDAGLRSGRPQGYSRPRRSGRPGRWVDRRLRQPRARRSDRQTRRRRSAPDGA